MGYPNNGAIMTLEQALSTLTDREGNKLEFTKQDDGTYTAQVKGKETTDQNGKKVKTYDYGFVLQPQPQLVTVEITKTEREKQQAKEIEEHSKELAGTKQGAAQVSAEQRASGTIGLGAGGPAKKTK
jgi:hypothetical protein